MIHNINPIIFTIPSTNLSFRYYGLIYVLGFVLFQLFMSYVDRRNYFPNVLGKKKLENFVFYSILWVVGGSRLFEILFYEPQYYFSNPLEIFSVWKGGLSFHGGLAGIIIYVFIFTRKNKIPTFLFFDVTAVMGALALSLGRIANFINGELFGLPVSNQIHPPWFAVLFQRTDPSQLYRYPVQLFEAFGNLITFGILMSLFLWKLNKKSNKIPVGLCSFLFLFLYGVFRFIFEFWKDYAQDTFLSLSTGQLLCIPMILFGGVYSFLLLRKPYLLTQ